eukprot:TRINITY_DN1027_c2_g1_i1.p1 TRINITY_DN1027_c2_g1~~TRINITY_DN1027_c2_g1_i1.p1  ORF type:complete len:355 (+),score=45.07 TRINITY_DN1027_c2_g1_i1:79-1143(+)
MFFRRINESDDIKQSNRVKMIYDALNKNPIDLDLLRKLSQGGLVNNTIRKLVWPKLLGVTKDDLKEDHLAVITNHKDTEQVKRDIDRSLGTLIEGDPILLAEKRKELSNIINAVISTDSQLNYFQGYHDIASVLLLICGEKEAYVLLKKVTNNLIRDYLNTNLDVVTALLNEMLSLLQIIDPEVHKFLVSCHMQPPYFAISWVLTWISHSIDDIRVLGRLFDFFLASHPYAIIYMCVSLITFRRLQLLKCMSEYSAVHKFLTTLPKELPIEVIIDTTLKYMKLCPPGDPRLKLPPKGGNLPYPPKVWKNYSDEKGYYSPESRGYFGFEYDKSVMFGAATLVIIAIVATVYITKM